MKKLQLAFTTTNGPLSWAIRTFTWSNFSHVDLYFPEENLLIGAVPFKGVISRNADEVFKQASKISVYEVDVDSELARSIIMGQIGKPYDWTAVMGFLLRRNWQETDSWDCSEIASYVILKAGLKLFNEDLNRITPRDLVIHNDLKLIEVKK